MGAAFYRAIKLWKVRKIMENKEYIVIAKSDPFMNFGVFKNADSAHQGRLKAEDYCLEEAREYRTKITQYPQMADFFTEQTKKYEAAYLSMEVYSYEDYLSFIKERMLDKEPTEVTQEDFDDALNCLPPLKWCTIDGVEMFLMSEFYWGSYTTQYAYDKVTGKYWCKRVDAYDVSTWLHKILRKDVK